MWIENMYLEDFGCYRHQQVRGFDPQLVVIAGPQRAGKTTFMRVLRHIGFGLPRGGGLPPAADRHSVQAEAVHDENRYLLQLSGFGEPRVIPQEGAPALTAEDLYGKLSPFAYHQIFTITLDELKRRPPSVAKNEEQRLQAVLLGAGWADVVRIPTMRQEFADEANGIGGKYGRAAYQLKAPVEQIREGIQLRREALTQVDEYNSLRSRQQQLSDSIRQGEDDRAKLQLRLTRLHLLDEHWEKLSQYRQIKQKLNLGENRQLLQSYPQGGRQRAEELIEELEATTEELAGVRHRLQMAAGEGDPRRRARCLVQHREALARYDRAISGWRERLHSFKRERDSIRSAWRSLGEAAGRIWTEWKDSPEKLADVRVDLVSRSELKHKTKELADLEDRLNSQRDQRHQLQDQLSELTVEQDSVGEASPRLASVRFTAAVVASCLAGWFSYGLWGPWPAVILTAGLFGLSGALLLPSVFGDFRSHQRRREIERLMASREREISELDDAVQGTEAEIQAVHSELKQLLARVGLPQQLEVGEIMEFYDRAVQLQKQLVDLRFREQEKERERERIEQVLSEPLRVMKEVRGFEPQEGDFLTWSEDLFSAVGASVEELKSAVRHDRLSRRKEKLQGTAEKLLGQDFTDADRECGDDLVWLSDSLRQFCEQGRRYEELEQLQETVARIESNLLAAVSSGQHPEALMDTAAYDDDDQKQEDLCLFQLLLECYAAFASRKQVSEERQRVSGELDEMNDRLSELRDEQAQVRQAMKSLSTDDSLRRAQAAIERGRESLRPLAWKYARLRISEFLLQRLQNRFMQRAHDDLLQEAAEVFSRITGREYEAIETLQDPSEPDFRAVNRGHPPRAQSSSALSGATREQLFLAVRMARIRQIEPALPVILDDSTANFDPRHRLRTANVINELSQTNQVFFLTCHPEMVKVVARASDSAQYWYVQRGEFAGPYPDPEELTARLGF